jgi:hypothetical protein
MWQTELKFEKFSRASLPAFAALAIILTGCFPVRSMAQQPGQKTFSSPDEACNAMVTAAQNNDEKALLEIFGPAGKQIVSSGDQAEDTQNRANFVARYHQMHRLVKEPDGNTVLYIGAENWPTPIPLVNRGKVWYFDTKAGVQEILFRRIGRNELSAISVCQELAAAQKEYFAAQHGEYAKVIFSEQGQHNGLYSKAAEGEPQSPIGPLLAAAFTDGEGQGGAPTPYRGYYYRLLRRQGKMDSGEAKDYVIDGRMTGGFAFLAYPAVYRSSGVMTFIVNEDGVVYQKDLGAKTETLAKAMKEYTVDSTWQESEEQEEQTASEEKIK